MPFGLALGAVSAGGSIIAGLFGKSAADKASQQQATTAQQGLDFQKSVYSDQKANQAPFVQAGQGSIAELMKQINAGRFGVDSLGPVPTAPGAFTDTFKAPTLEEARATPGYQFTQEQGSKGVLQGAAAAGGAIGGGTLKALDTFNTGLADSTYGDVFNRALSTYGAGLNKYQANLAGYGSQLAGFKTGQDVQQQEFGQLFNTASLGAGSTNVLNNTGTATAGNVGQLLSSLGAAQASGTVGGANAISGSIGGATNGIVQSLLLQKLLTGGGLGGNGSTPPFVSPNQNIALGERPTPS